MIVCMEFLSLCNVSKMRNMVGGSLSLLYEEVSIQDYVSINLELTCLCFELLTTTVNNNLQILSILLFEASRLTFCLSTSTGMVF